MSLAGIPVYTEKGKNGGISLLPDYVLNKSLLSEKEQQEILAALHGLSSVKTDATKEVLGKLSTFFKKSAVPWMEVDCGTIKRLKQPFTVSKTYCGCCAGHFRYHYQNALGVKLRLKEIVSSPLDSNGEKPCSIRFDIVK